jgi:hypothetical protein
VSIHSQEDQINVWAVARGNRVWIGLTDRVTTDISGRTTGAEARYSKLTVAPARSPSHTNLTPCIWIDQGTWTWADGSPVDYLHWNAAQPDNADAAGGLHLDGSAVGDPAVEHEDCGEMYSGYGGEWNDRMCSDAGYLPHPNDPLERRPVCIGILYCFGR